MTRTRFHLVHLAFGALVLPLLASGCATLAAAHGSAVKSDEITARVTTLEGQVTTLSTCATRGKPEDHGIIAVAAAPDGTISVDAVQWYGSDDMKACIAETAGKTKLAPWSGGTISALWLVGTKEHPAPTALAENPPGFQQRLSNLMAEAYGTSDMGPLNTCVQQNLPNDAYAKVDYRLTVFPDGKVAAVAPVSIDGEGRDSGYQDCLRNVIKAWTFDPFPGPGYVSGVVPFKKGVDSTFK